ncbi:MAG: disulfide bond formation protein B [Gammaproteobacteria bacterium]|jgi:hypothetical protein
MTEVMKYIKPLGVIAILISAFTWGLELMHYVPPCPYCQVQRTIIGLLGILMVLPNIRYATLLLTIALGLFGTNVSSDQIFIMVREQQFLNSIMFLAASASFIIAGQMIILVTRAFKTDSA